MPTLKVMRPLSPSTFPVASLGGNSAVHGGTLLLSVVEGLGTLYKEGVYSIRKPLWFGKGHTDFRPEIIILLVVLGEYKVCKLFEGQSHCLSSHLNCWTETIRGVNSRHDNSQLHRGAVSPR